MVGILETLVKAGAVFGLLALTVRLLRRVDGTSRRRKGARARTAPWVRTGRTERLLEVVERTGVGRAATVVVVRVADEHWVLGVTDNGVTRLGDVDLDDTDTDDTADTDADTGVVGHRTTDERGGAGSRATGGPGSGTASDGRRGAGAAATNRAVLDLRHPAAQWAERVRSLRDRLPERERAEDLDLPPLGGPAGATGASEPSEPAAPLHPAGLRLDDEAGEHDVGTAPRPDEVRT